MKPNFALGLTSDGITLWQRGRSGWLRVGAVDPEAPERDVQLADLARIAHALAPEGVTTKLVIPDEQILFCDLEVGSRSRAEQEREIRAQLDGRTPYPVEELDFDWTINGGQVHVAVVARETLIEAEEFARSFGLNPVSAAAAPLNGHFNREPFFGTTRLARSIVGDPGQIEREPEILRETGVVQLPEPELVGTEAVKAGSSNGMTEKAETGDGPTTPTASQTLPDSPQSATTASLSGVEAASQGGTEAGAEAAPKGEAEPEGTPKGKAGAGSAAEPSTGFKRKAAQPTQDSVAASGSFANFLKSRGKKQEPDKAAAGDDPVLADTASESVPLTFSSRRGTAAKSGSTRSTAKPKGGMLGSLRARLAGSAALRGSGSAIAQKLRASLSDLKPQVAGTPSLTEAVSSKPVLGALSPSSDTSAQETASSRAGSAKPAAPSAAPAREPAASAPAKQVSRRDPLETLRNRSNAAESQTEAERMTIFGARQHAEAEPSGMNRGLLILGGVGLLLAAVAVWVFFFTSTQPPAPDTTALTEPAEIVAPEATVPADQAVLPDPALLPDELVASDEIEAALGLEDAAQQPPIDALVPETLGQAEAIGGNGVAAPTPPADLNAGRVAGLRSVALLAPQEALPLPVAPQPPAPFGSEPLPPLREELAVAAAPPLAPETDAPDALPSGLPAGEDALEIVVTEGRPPVTPPERPAGIAPEPPPPPQPEPATEAAPEILDESALQITVTDGRPTVAPPQRPAGIAPETAPETVEPEAQPADDPESGLSEPDQASLDTPPPGGVALTGLRPAARPEQIVLAALAPEPAPIPGAEDASDLAVAASMRPGARPSQFSAIVQRALRSAQPRTTTAVPAATAAPAPEAPVQTARAAVAAPVIPTSASVAREATQARAINLRQVNLIGVMGTSSNRRALVRLSNGRVVTVRVGESLDGGQVTAIGENELRYTRRGRDVVLRIAS